MMNVLFTRRQQVLEPTVLALGLVVLGLLVLLAACVAAVVAFSAFGHGGWVLAAVAAALAGLLLARRGRPRAAPATGRQKALRRTLGFGRWLFVGVLAAWAGLLAWSLLGPGGPAPPPKADPDQIRVVSWNIHCGHEGGPPWQQLDWPARKHALRAAVVAAGPDVLCVQEAVAEQVAFLEQVLPGHTRVGVGRDDGESGGEHCAIYFDRGRFRLLDQGTFWLEEPTDVPRPGSAFTVKRICTWVRLRDRVSGRVLRVYNTHQYLTEADASRGAQLILAHIASGDPNDAPVVAADFNAGPGAPSRRNFAEPGLADSAALAGRPPASRPCTSTASPCVASTASWWGLAGASTGTSSCAPSGAPPSPRTILAS